MKTSEFIKRVEELGYQIKRVDYNKTIEVFEGQKYHGCVTEKGINVVRTNNAIPNVLFDLMVEYAKTSIEDREEPKRYRIRPKGMIVLGGASFSYNPYGEYWYLENDPSTDHTTTFTLKELEGLGIDVEHYDLEEVE